MKTLFIVLSLCFSGSLVTSNMTENLQPETNHTIIINESENDMAGPTISIKIEFGRPAKGCSGFGICGIDIDFGAAVQGPNAIEARASNVGGRLSLDFLTETISPRTAKTYLDGQFVMDEDFTIPRSLVNQLGLTTNVISKGTYSVTNTRGGALKVGF